MPMIVNSSIGDLLYILPIHSCMTANLMKEEVDSCFAVGMDDFISKPFDTEDLLQKLAALIVTDEITSLIKTKP